MYLAQLKRTTIYSKGVLDMETLSWIERVPFLTWFGDLESLEGTDGNAGTDDQGTPGAGDGNDDAGNEDFLVVDDRTRYRSSEDAIRGFQEAGQRIAELTPWQTIASEYGLTDPQDVAALLDELAELRARRNAGDEPASRGGNADVTNVSRTSATPTNLDPNSPEGKQAAALEWLKSNGVAAGMVSKDQLSEINERLDYLNQEAERVDNERFEQRMEYGRNVLNNELRTSGYFPTDPKDAAGLRAANELSSMLEDALTTWVNADERRVRAFHAGGESLSNLIKQGLNIYLPRLNVLKSSSSANDAARRVNTNRGVRAATPAATTRPGQPKITPRTTGQLKAEDGITPDVHERAWEVASKIFGDHA